jgi:hypothetical protein
MEQARRANREDAMMYQAIVNREIAESIRANNQTGDLGYLCLPAYYGHQGAIEVLIKNNIVCNYR